jgi:hypothetical protein
MNVKTISVARDFSETPAGRHKDNGPYTGQSFREDFLVPALNSYDYVIVDLDGTLGYGSSFLEEAFGGLIREHSFKLALLNEKLEIKSSRRLYSERVKSYLKNADKEAN